jgi:hypothetical protein
MTAREFLNWALEGDFDQERALFELGQYIGKGGSYFVSFPDADVVDQDGNLLSESPEEPARFQEFFENRA